MCPKGIGFGKTVYVDAGWRLQNQRRVSGFLTLWILPPSQSAETEIANRSKRLTANFQVPFRPSLRGSLFWRGGGPIGEGDGAAATNDGGEDVVETFMFFRGIVQLEVRPEAQIEFVDGFDTSNQPFAR